MALQSMLFNAPRPRGRPSGSKNKPIQVIEFAIKVPTKKVKDTLDIIATEASSTPQKSVEGVKEEVFGVQGLPFFPRSLFSVDKAVTEKMLEGEKVHEEQGWFY
jgi:hypothetical protein